MSGYWVVEAIREFFDMPATLPRVTLSEGFVIIYGGGGEIVRVTHGATINHNDSRDGCFGADGQARKK